MRVTGFHVDGFGLLADQGVDDVGPGTTVVLGPNEAGKSTLHAFLVRTLFGHPRANDAEGRNRHEPLRGGRHGGVVHCEDDAGRWEVHRYTEGSPRLRVVAPDGTEHTGNDAVLPLLGRTVDEARYEQVFAIDLDDLAGIGTLGGGSLDDLLFDAATVGTGRSLRAARDEAVDRRDALWTPTATKRPLAEALTRRADARDALAAARDAARDNLDTRRRLDAAAARVDELAAQQEREAARIALLERVRDAWPSWSRAEQLRAELADLPDVAVDEGVLEQARAAAADLEAATGRADALRVERDRIDRAIDEVPTDPDALAVADDVEALAEGLGAHGLVVEQLAAATADLEAAATGTARAMAELGDGWDVAAVTAVPADAPTRQRLEAAGDALQDARLRAEAVADRAREATRVARRREAALEEAMAALPEAPSEDEVASAERAIGVLRIGVPALQQGSGDPATGTPAWAGPVGAGLLGVAAVALLGIVLGLLPAGGPTWAAATVAAIAAAAGAYLLGMRARSGARATVSGTGAGGQRDLARQVVAAAQHLGLPPQPSLGEVEEVAIRTDAARRRRRERADAQRHLATVRAEAEDAVQVAADRRDTAQACERDLQEATVGWTAACAAAGLDDDEPVRVTVTLHQRIAAAQRALADRDAAEGRVERLRPRADHFRDDAAAVAGKLGHDVDGEAAVHLLPGLRDRVRAARSAQAERERLAARREELTRQVEDVQGTARAAQDVRDRALAAVGVTDLPALEERAAVAQQREEVALELEAATRNLDQLLGDGPRGEEGRRLLQQADPAAWEQELASAEQAVVTLTRERDEALAERTELEAELRRLGGDDAVPRAEQELAAAQVEVTELAERWAVADTAARLLEATVARFEREQQPRVLMRASELLARATGGQWAQVRRLDGQVVVSRSEGGDPVAAEVLSRGTREQLWLCLRLALAEDLSQDRPLPLLVDDLLGTSDPERSLHVARVLAEIAGRQQVWLFTCHPRTAELVTSTDPTAGVLRLRRGGHITGLTRRDVTGDDRDEDSTLRLDL